MTKTRHFYQTWLPAVLLALIALTFKATPALAVGGGVLYVDADASGPTHDGLSWTTAYTDVQDALTAATSGSEIWVAQGVYYPTKVQGVRRVTAIRRLRLNRASPCMAGLSPRRPSALNATGTPT